MFNLINPDRLKRYHDLFPPVFLQVSILLSYNIVAREYFNFERPHWILLIGCFIGVSMYLGLDGFKNATSRKVATALIISLGGMLQIYSPMAWPYLLLPAVAMLSRRFIRFEGRHIFNPSNFALVFIFELFPSWVVNSPQLFSSYIFVSAIFFGLGLINSLYAGTWRISLVWYFCFMALSSARTLMGQPSFFLAYQAFNPLLILFTFHMINDPQTTPKSSRGQILFAFSVATADAVLRYNQFAASPYYALIFVSAMRPILEILRKPWLAQKAIKIEANSHGEM